MGTHFVFTIPVDIIPANQQAYTMMKLLAIFALAFIATASALDITTIASGFALLDTNKDGAIDAAELVAAASSQGLEATLSQAAAIIKIVSGKDTMTLSDIQGINKQQVAANVAAIKKVLAE